MNDYIHKWVVGKVVDDKAWKVKGKQKEQTKLSLISKWIPSTSWKIKRNKLAVDIDIFVKKKNWFEDNGQGDD